jgi:predicted enzyme related to lactoylglutathione lyase
VTVASAKLSSILLSSSDPQRLHDWYVAALPPDVDQTQDPYRILGYGDFWVLIDQRDDVGPKNQEPGRLILNFEVDDAHAAVSRLDQAGTDWLSPREDRDGSFFATAIDPDGNYVQVVQLSEEAVAAMSQGTGE